MIEHVQREAAMGKAQKQKGPDRTDREGLTVVELFDIFPDEAAARTWFERTNCLRAGWMCSTGA